ncbi:hypothetical protein GIY56_06440 [Paracoccus sp. YIM 132242]|uniref:Uncharacterized protein n=1 Tax=Paracoccus lichenicola TaxID=2665644 RepID=A0A6L6HN62_9RHOB|nr:hypothetical protein [Paracoccus lichenicola]MTD99918.1 hypothetical protein [Paracoccus lichenicola]
MPRVLEHGTADSRTPAFVPTPIDDDAWDEFKPHLTRLEAVVTDNYVSGSDPVICVRDEDGRNWTVELASRARNTEIGLKESAAMPGDPVRVIGRRTRHFGEQRIKAVHLTIAGRPFELYPGALG